MNPIQRTAKRRLFPIFLKMSGRHCLVVGGGKAGEAKVRGLLDTGAEITVVALQASETVRQWSRQNLIILKNREFAAADLDEMELVISATSSKRLNDYISRQARERKILCNVVDVPSLCDFFYPAVVTRGDLQIAVSTSGHSPSLAQRIKQQLERQFGVGYAAWVAELGETRQRILRSELAPPIKEHLLGSLASRHAFESIHEVWKTCGKEEQI